MERAHGRNGFFTSWQMKNQESRMKDWQFKYSHLKTAPSAISLPFHRLISERLCSLLQAPGTDDQALHIYLPNHSRENVFVFSLIYSPKCNHPDRLDCKVFPGMSELDFSRDFLALNAILSFISYIFSISLVVSQTAPG